jgi:hypothetical protein
LSLSPTGSGTTAGLAIDGSSDARYLVPGDLSSVSEISHGSLERVDGLGSLGRDAGIWLPDGTHHGLFTLGDEADAQLCALLVP